MNVMIDQRIARIELQARQNGTKTGVGIAGIHQHLSHRALGEAERARVMRHPPQDLGAWEAYQRGLWLLEHGAGADNEKARAFFQQAISRDATLACACSGLA